MFYLKQANILFSLSYKLSIDYKGQFVEAISCITNNFNFNV